MFLYILESLILDIEKTEYESIGSLYTWLFINGYDNCIVRRIHVQANNIHRLSGEFRVGRNTP